MGQAELHAQMQSLVARLATVPLFCLVFSVASLAGCAENNPGVDILFADGSSHLNATEKRAIASLVASMFPLSADGRRFEHPDCGDVTPISDVVDLNGDDDYEIFVSWGNVCTSGGTGRSLTLISRDGDGEYRMQLGFPAFGWTALAPNSLGWPDLSFGGPGFCHAVWTWRRDGYEFKCNLAETEGGCESRDNIC